jgi:Leucine-rich repeat (LRR) protein
MCMMRSGAKRGAAAAGAVLLVASLLGLSGQAAGQTVARTFDVYLSMSRISLTERAGSTDITVTATLREASAAETRVRLALLDGPVLTPGVAGVATVGADYATTLDGDVITIPAGSVSGEATFAVDPAYDTDIEGDEAIVLGGRAHSGGSTGSVAPVDLIIEDGPYLSFPKRIHLGNLHREPSPDGTARGWYKRGYIYGAVLYPGQPASVTVEEATDKSSPDATVSYELTGTEPGRDPLGLAFDPATRELSGTVPAAAAVPASGLVTRYTITATDSAGHTATTLVSVAVVADVCGPTVASWFHPTDEPPEELVQDCNLLLAAKDTLRGAGALNWSTGTPIDSWVGLSQDLSMNPDNQHITEIDLRLARLDGSIPPLLGHLRSPHLSDLVLGGDYRPRIPSLENRLTGTIPPELGLLANLRVLALSYNNLTGPIPRELANNGLLRSLYVHDTDTVAAGVSGPIPPEFADLPMRNLSISGNRGVDGHIPWQLGKNSSSGDHPGLQALNLYGNSLEGAIPWQLGRFDKIQQMALNDNRLTGAIPWQLGGLGRGETDLSHRVVRLYLHLNRLTGDVPPHLGDIANLHTLVLSANQLTGTIPPDLGKLSKLENLLLRDNRLRGHIPAELARLTELRVLAMQGNRLAGTVPWQLGGLSELIRMTLDGNALSGRIPASLGQLTNLRVLSLSCNALRGTVPTAVIAIEALTVLNLQGNAELALSADELPGRAGLTLTRGGPCQWEDFVDVDAGGVHAASIDALWDAGITVGCGSEPLRYCPEDPVTRAQMASFLRRALDLPAAVPSGFVDVDARGVHTASIDALRAAGITVGCGSEPLRYCPEDPVTRAEMASFLRRALDLSPAVSAGFVDVGAHGVHAASIDALRAAGITVGCGSEPLRYCPEAPVTRAEMASFLQRALDLPAD